MKYLLLAVLLAGCHTLELGYLTGTADFGGREDHGDLEAVMFTFRPREEWEAFQAERSHNHPEPDIQRDDDLFVPEPEVKIVKLKCALEHAEPPAPTSWFQDRDLMSLLIGGVVSIASILAGKRYGPAVVRKFKKENKE